MRKCAVASIRAPPPPRHRHLEHWGLSSSQPLAVGGLAVGSWYRASTYSDAPRGRHADTPHVCALALSQTHAPRALTHRLHLPESARWSDARPPPATRLHLQRRASTSSDAPPHTHTHTHIQAHKENSFVKVAVVLTGMAPPHHTTPQHAHAHTHAHTRTLATTTMTTTMTTTTQLAP